MTQQHVGVKHFGRQDSTLDRTMLFGFDGVLGLGGIVSGSTVTNPSHIPVLNYFGVVRPTLLYPLFSLSLNRDHEGVLTFGYVLPLYSPSELEWETVVEEQQGRAWVLQVTAWEPGPGGSPLSLDSTAVLDAGSAYIYLPRRMVTQYLTQLQIRSTNTFRWRPNPLRNGSYLFQCRTALSDIAFYFSGRQWVVYGDNLRGPSFFRPFYAPPARSRQQEGGYKCSYTQFHSTQP